MDLSSQCVLLPLEQAQKTYGLFLRNRGIKDQEGLFFYAPPGSAISTPLQLSSPRLYIFLGEGASLSLYDFSKEDRFLHVDLAASSQFTSVSHSTAGKQTYTVSLNGEGASAELRGLLDLSGKEEGHVDVLMEHHAPHCRSRQHFKFVLQDQSRSSFAGKIYVHQAAQKTESYQLNQNLLLSDEAFASSKPNLEIFADDVKASHGATFSQLNAEELFYFRSRGFSEAEAKELLRKGFCQEILNFLPAS